MNKIALCNQYLVARTNIAAIRLVVLGSNARKYTTIGYMYRKHTITENSFGQNNK
jgi:hypothetical protein